MAGAPATGAIALLAVLSALVAPVVLAPPAVAGKQPVEAIQAESEIPEDLLLDVGIRVFDPGLPEEDESALEEQGIYADVRRAEARWVPYHLKNSLEATGQWGAVRVLPTGAEKVDVLVTGEIVLSNGLFMVVDVKAVDAKGRVWRDGRYKCEADPFAYVPEALEADDPYQSLYNEIANDLVKSRDKLKEDEIRELRELSRMRFAQDIAPASFGDYLSVNKRGKWSLERLPAAGDTMMVRVAGVSERDDMFVDTINEFYAEFYANMREPYDDWRTFSFEEQQNLREIRRKARTRKILGGLLLLGAAFAEPASSAAGAARDAAAIGGAITLASGIEKGKEAKIHREALKELAASFDAEIAPLVVEVEGRTLKLEGSAETQYAEWREFLTRIFSTETGLPVDADSGTPGAADDGSQ
jgi:hypothetical protein